MKILSISDIHGNLEALELLYFRMPLLKFDVVLIAGDLGDAEEAKVICQKLSSFGKPVFYVQGNWDDYLFDEVLHHRATHIHLNHQKVGDWIFLGYSGSAANGYRNHPTLNRVVEEYINTPKSEIGSFESFCKEAIFKEISDYIDKFQIDVDALVLVTHDRLYALPFSPFVYIFGHRHRPKYTYHKGIHLVNTSAVFMDSALQPDAPGNYCMLYLDGLNFKAEFEQLPSPYFLRSHPYFPYSEIISKMTGKSVGIINNHN